MLKKILPWVGGMFAAVGLILIFYDVIVTIKKRDKTKTNIAALIILSVAVLGYVVTDLILPAAMPDGSGWPALASFVWIALFWMYVLLDAVTMLGDIKHNRSKNKKDIAETTQIDETDNPEKNCADSQSETEDMRSDKNNN